MIVPFASYPKDPPLGSNAQGGSGQLAAVLEEMVQAHQYLLALLQAEKRLMIEGEIKDLTRCFKEKEEILESMRILEARRQEETRLLANRLGKIDPPLTLKQLIPLILEPDQSRLRSCHSRLEALMASILEINQINGLLVERILKQITSLLGLLQQLTGSHLIYQPTGSLCDMRPSGKTIGKG